MDGKNDARSRLLVLSTSHRELAIKVFTSERKSSTETEKNREQKDMQKFYETEMYRDNQLCFWSYIMTSKLNLLTDRTMVALLELKNSKAVRKHSI